MIGISMTIDWQISRQASKYIGRWPLMNGNVQVDGKLVRLVDWPV